MDDPRGEMLGMLNSIHQNNYSYLYSELDRSQLKYAIYLRKSSDESSGKQLKSIGDQLNDIKAKILDPYKITNFDIVKDELSAKEADTRYDFSKMLTDLRAGKYQGLIAWHPDRLARNMKEAGEIIDMLDRHIIKDLLFATATYEDNANGKMMLGITFALSKQYSEHLGESVDRGYSRRTEEGKYLGKMVHGYRIMDDGLLEPDDKNFLVIQQAFRMRLQNPPISQVEIAKWLNKQDYMQCFGRQQKYTRVRFDDRKVSDMLRETIYTGFMSYGKTKPVDLTECYDFTPMISVEEYKSINKTSDDLERIVTKRGVISKTKLINLLKGRVTCGHCNGNMHSNPGTGKMGKTYVYFRCSNEHCPFMNSPTNLKHFRHQVRSNIVIKAAIDTLAAAEFDLKKAYANYVRDAKKAIVDEQYDLLSQERRVMANIKNTEQDLDRAKQVIADPDKADIAGIYKEDIRKYIETDLPLYKKDLAEIKKKQDQLKLSVVGEEKFLKLVDTAVNYIGQLKNLDQIDEILQKFYSNFTILDKAVSVITFNQEWYDVLNPTWLGVRDSNPRSWDQNPVPYRLANSHQ